MASQAGAHLFLQNTSIHAPLPHLHPSLLLGFGAKRLPTRKQREERDGEEVGIASGLPHSPRPPPLCHP